MRILVISDSHGRNDDIEGVLKQVGDIDMMIHCGDVERGDSYIREIAAVSYTHLDVYKRQLVT